MKKISVLVRDKNTLVLTEDAKKDDIIDLTELSNVDFSAIEQAIEIGKDKVYIKKLEEYKSILKLENENEKQKLQAKIDALLVENSRNLKEKEDEVSKKYLESINKLNTELGIVKSTKEQEIKLRLNEQKELYQQQLEELRYSNNELITKHEKEMHELNLRKIEESNKIKEDANKEINNLKNELNLLHQLQETNLKIKESEIEKRFMEKLNKLEKEFNEKLKEKEDLINNLQRQKASLNVKQTGEDLEAWCNNEMLQYMQNGFSTCSWQKDNTVVKEDDEIKGSKADYIFKVYASTNKKEDELLASVCLEMKDENPNSHSKQTNDHFYSQLDKNRKKKECKYALLVSNLEMDKPNVLPIFKVREYEDMYVVRPGYMVTFLNMITSLTTRFSDLILSKEAQMIEIKDRLNLIEEFEKIKNTYLEKPLELLQKEVNSILKSNETIKKAYIEIDNTCNKIITSYINQITAKIDKFEIKLNRELKKANY